MKRTPLQRKTPLRCKTPMKRGCPLKKKGNNRGKKECASVIAKYRRENPECEFVGLFDPPGGHLKQLETHHIARIRWDVLTCILRLCPNCHHRLGHANDKQFVVWCLWKKMKKGELDWEFLEKNRRGRSLLTFLEVNDKFEAITNDMIIEVLSYLKGNE